MILKMAITHKKYLNFYYFIIFDAYAFLLLLRQDFGCRISNGNRVFLQFSVAIFT